MRFVEAGRFRHFTNGFRYVLHNFHCGKHGIDELGIALPLTRTCNPVRTEHYNPLILPASTGRCARCDVANPVIEWWFTGAFLFQNDEDWKFGVMSSQRVFAECFAHLRSERAANGVVPKRRLLLKVRY